MKAGGAKGLWLLTTGLAVIFLAVWAADRASGPVVPKQTPRSVIQATDAGPSKQDGLNDLAKRDAAGRVAAGATIQLNSVEPRHFEGPDLREVIPTAPGAQLGSVITLVAVIEGKPISRLIYHAVPPKQVVFVRQEAP